MKIYKLLILIFAVTLVVLSYRLWLADDGHMEVRRLEREIAEQQVELEAKQQRNRELAAEVKDLKDGVDAVEERARSELGMTKDDETFVQIVEPAGEEVDSDPR